MRLPELMAKGLPARLVVLADRRLMRARAQALGISGEQINLRDWVPDQPPSSGTLDILHVPLPVTAQPGKLDSRNASYVLHLLDRALDGFSQLPLLL